MFSSQIFSHKGPLRSKKVTEKYWLDEYFLDSENKYLRVVVAQQQGLNLSEWISKYSQEVCESLILHGGILFRNFEVRDPKHFSDVVNSLSPNMLDYLERAAPRHEVAKKIFTSTEYSSDVRIPLHHEMSYSHNWPIRLYFYCENPPKIGGQTPLANERRVTARIPKRIKDRFRDLGVCYVRNYGPEIDISWQEAFQTEHRSEVEKYCKDTMTEYYWIDDHHLRTRQVRQAMICHPETDELLWFNHAHLFHISNVSDPLAQILLADFGEKGIPRNAYYGDGSDIELETLDVIRNIYHEEELTFTWERNDILILDNFISVHGRESYAGDRRILVAMTDLYTNNQLFNHQI